MNSKRITILSIVFTICLCLFAGISVYAVSTGNQENSFKKGHHFEDDGTIHKLAKVEEVTDTSITLTLGQEPEETEEKPTEGTLADNFKASDQKVTLKITDSSKIDSVKSGDIVMVNYNDQNELLSIRNANDIQGHKGGKNHKVARIDKIDGTSIIVTYGELNKPENIQDSSSTEFDPSKNFTAGTEQKTLTVKDASELEGLTTGSIVMIELDDEDENVIDEIHNISDMSKGRENHKVARIDKIDGTSVVVTYGELSKPENNQDSNSIETDPSKNFTAGTEQKTLTVKDTSELEGLTTGTIVMIELDDEDENVIDEIHSLNNMPQKGMCHGRGKFQSESNTGNSSTPTQTQNQSANASLNNNISTMTTSL